MSNYQLLEDAHRGACVQGHHFGQHTTQRQLCSEIALAIEGFLKSDRDGAGVAIEVERLNKMQAIRANYLPESEDEEGRKESKKVRPVTVG